MRLITKGEETVVVSMTWNELQLITGKDFSMHGRSRALIFEGEEFSVVKFATSVANARLAWETKAKMKELLRGCEENLDRVFFPMQPMNEEGSK